MVPVLTTPYALEFLVLAMRSEFHDVQLDEIKITGGSALVGNSLKGLKFRGDIGVIVIGIVRANGEMVFNPSADFVFGESDTMIGIGSQEQFDKLRRKL